MNNKRLVGTVIIVFVAAVAGAIGYFALIKRQAPSIETNQAQQTNAPIIPQTPTATNKPTPASSTPKNTSKSNVDDCDLIGSSAFRSINQYEVGLGPNGPTMGYWSIQFQKGTTLSDYGRQTFRWHHSDVSENGTYTCKRNVLQVKFLDHSITASYNGNQEILTWDGVEYKRVK